MFALLLPSTFSFIFSYHLKGLLHGETILILMPVMEGIFSTQGGTCRLPHKTSNDFPRENVQIEPFLGYKFDIPCSLPGYPASRIVKIVFLVF